MIEEDTVRQAIHSLIERKEKRIDEIREITVTEQVPYNRFLNEQMIVCIEYGVTLLTELECTLNLCDCLPGAHEDKGDLA